MIQSYATSSSEVSPEAVEVSPRQFANIIARLNRLWLPGYVDRRENYARGILHVGQHDFQTHLIVQAMEQAIGLRFLIDVGTLNPKQLPRALATLLMLQADGRVCRFALDHESLQLRLDAGVYIGIDVDPTSILRSILNDLRSMLSEDRLLACVENLPDRRFSEMEV